jgi:hypothetical protein
MTKLRARIGRLADRLAEPPTPSQYRTSNLNLAAYLVASHRLVLHHVAPAAVAEFFFLDPDGLGPAIAEEYATKNLKVSARLLLDARARLLNEMRRGGGGAL